MLVTRCQKIHVSLRELKAVLRIQPRDTITQIVVLAPAGDPPENPVSIVVHTAEPTRFKGIGK